jgi:hypothetical protein
MVDQFDTVWIQRTLLKQSLKEEVWYDGRVSQTNENGVYDKLFLTESHIIQIQVHTELLKNDQS